MPQLGLNGLPVPPRGATSERFPLEPVTSARWPQRIEALARAMGTLSLTAEQVFVRAREGLGKEWCQRRVRCVLALGLDCRFLYTPPPATGPSPGLWRVRRLRVEPATWRWSQGWHRWYIVGLEEEAARACAEEVHELSNVSERFEMALKERKGDEA